MPGVGVDVSSGWVRRAAMVFALPWLCATAACAVAVTLPPLVDERGGLGAGWRVVTLPAQKSPITRYTAERVDGRDALRVEAAASYGNLVYVLPGVPAPRTLRWAWRMQQPNAAADLRVKTGDDVAVKVCLSFDLPLSAVPFVERQLLRLARSHSGEELPAATLCWVWAAAEQNEPLHGVNSRSATWASDRAPVLSASPATITATSGGTDRASSPKARRKSAATSRLSTCHRPGASLPLRSTIVRTRRL